MPILAYYLLDAGLSEHDAAWWLAARWPITNGDENYVAIEPKVGGTRLVGAYGIPVSWRPDGWPNNRSGIAADAIAVAGENNPDAIEGFELLAQDGYIQQHIIDAAREAVMNPVAGYTDQAEALAAMIPPPITTPRTR